MEFIRIIIWILMLSPALVIGQTTFTSPLTQHNPESIPTTFEDIERTLEINSENITLTTTMDDGKLFEVYDILEKKDGLEDVRFLCSSRNKENLVTVIIPNQKKIEILDIYRRSDTTWKVEHLRLWLD
ncbi:hypothetical protein [Salinimicrobium xinjiangense]|uniref:hypothetical protein n=1 Tax=Salinimicrobium xinjiangense TaxID=438596 RepID=UPI00048E6550|nr:hypothetical protein [Salinimicrobium xinjiangense]